MLNLGEIYNRVKMIDIINVRGIKKNNKRVCKINALYYLLSYDQKKDFFLSTKSHSSKFMVSNFREETINKQLMLFKFY